MVFRDRDTTANGTLDERVYYCQNWRADVVALVTDAGGMLEWVRYSPYGVPFASPAGDTDSDGDADTTDSTQIQAWIDTSAYDVRGDLDLDGDVDATDRTSFDTTVSGQTLGRAVLSRSDVNNTKGYAGYQHDNNITLLMHVRHRVYHAGLGRWTRRDPLGYVNGMSLYEHVLSHPLDQTDPSGLARVAPVPPCTPGGGVVPFGAGGCGGGAQPTPIPSPLPPYTPPGGPQIDTCTRMVRQGCWEDPYWGPRLQAELGRIRTAGCGVPTSACVQCDDSSPGVGWTTCGTSRSSIRVCRGLGAEETCRTLYHEYIHARQNCERGGCEPGLTPQECVMDELEAYMSDGTCDNWLDSGRYTSEQDCLCRYACGSCHEWWASDEACLNFCMSVVIR